MGPLDKQLLLTIFTNMAGIRELSEDKRRKRIKWIMNDLEEDGLFDEPDYHDFDDYDDFDAVVDAYCGGGISVQEAKLLADNITAEQTIITQQADSLSRIKRKRQELSLISQLNIELDETDLEDSVSKSEIEKTAYPYGRSPLHHAIAMMDLKSVERMIKDEMYLDSVDNNGDTPLEMAFNQGNKAVLRLFKKNNILRRSN
jgi:hypothetical protein